MPITIKDLLKMEQVHRNGGRWLQYFGEVINDRGELVIVKIKSCGFYNQFLCSNDGINHCSGHTIDKATKMHEFLRSKINSFPSVATKTEPTPVS